MFRFMKNQAGQAMAEFALVVPVLILAVFGGYDVVSASGQQNKVESFYNELITIIADECPPIELIYEVDNNGNLTSASSVGLLLKKEGLSLDNFEYINDGPTANWDAAEIVEGTDANATKFRIEFVSANNTYHFMFAYKSDGVISSIFNGTFRTERIAGSPSLQVGDENFKGIACK